MILLQEAVNVLDVKVLKGAQANIVNPDLCKCFSVLYPTPHFDIWWISSSKAKEMHSNSMESPD